MMDSKYKNDAETLPPAGGSSADDAPASKDRRDAVVKLAYASPLVAGLLLSKRAAAMSPEPPPPFEPPDPPSG